MVPISSSKPIAEPDALKIAIAVAFAISRTKRLGQQSAAPASSLADAEIQRWKRKAEERKRELISLKEELKQLEEGREPHSDAVPQVISCRCHFFDGCGLLSARATGIGEADASCNDWIDDALRRRFLRHVRWREKQRKLEGSRRKRHCVDVDDGNEMDWLCTSVEFLLALCSSNLSENDYCNYASLSHQATDSILVSLKKLSNKDDEIVEGVVSRLLTSLLQRMWPTLGENGTRVCSTITDIHIQHLIRTLGEESYIGQRALLLVSQKITCLADSLLVTDPFDDSFPDIHDYMYMMMQLTEFIIHDNCQVWSKNGNLDSKLLEEWLRSILQARKALKALENRSDLYLVYLDRIIGATTKQVRQLPHHQALNSDLLSTLLCS